MDYTTIIDWLKENLSDERFEHTLGTAECAEELAERFKLDSQKAYLCGLLHDCAKCLPNDVLKAMICDCGFLCEGEIENPKTYHAPAGAILAKKEFDICDDEILSAIRWHTLGKVDMTDFEKIIFLADKIETKTRPAELILPIRAVLNEANGLDKALLICYGNTIKSLVDRNLKICKVTVDIYNDLLKKLDLKIGK